MLLCKQIIFYNFAFKMKKLLYIIPILLLLVACATTKYVEIPVETVKTEYITNLKVDSIYITDSIDRQIRGDTIIIYREHIEYKYKNKIDTVIKVDSIPKIIKVETIKEVEVNHVKWYQKLLMWLGGIVTLILFIYVFIKIKF